MHSNKTNLRKTIRLKRDINELEHRTLIELINPRGGF